MFRPLMKKVLGTKNERELKRLRAQVARINALEPELQTYSDAQLQQQTPLLRQRYEQGESLDSLLPEAFALVRESAWRILGMRHFDVQLVGGIVLHSGKIAEMKTGEGKTLVATLPCYLNALTGKGVHVVTVNDYLARRDAEWMGRLYQFLGLSVGSILHGMDDNERQQSYACDIVYGTNNEFGFDYLRDNMKFDLAEYVQRDLHFAIIDEVDSILIDEARTPLIISGPGDTSSDLYYRINSVIPRLQQGEVIEHRDSKLGQTVKETTGDYTVDEKAKNANLTEQGVAKVERLLGVDNLFDPQHIELVHHVNQALKAHALFKRDVDYVVKDNEVIIVDEFTGRLMPGRRWSDGLHQAVEAKEGVDIESENQTLATITFQNYFRMYDKLSGMTGTADTEATEFKQIYELDVVVVPTNKPMIRQDLADLIYKSVEEKFRAVVEDIAQRYQQGQPVLVGTISIENSELVATMLKKRGIPHNVLNAKHHEREAEIVAQAGRKGAVTIATNMAGRGTDIVLGGNPEMLLKAQPDSDSLDDETASARLQELQAQCEAEKEEVVAAGGLYILGTERHESRRIDNQLRGRSGRQGDPGESRFYLSLEDNLLRIFGSQKVSAIMERLRIPDDEPIEHGMVSRAIENAQRKVESHNFDIRKHLLQYDDVLNRQREAIYEQRKQVLAEEGLRDILSGMVRELVADMVGSFCPEKVAVDEWDWSGLHEDFGQQFGFIPQIPEDMQAGQQSRLEELLYEQVQEHLRRKEEEEFGTELMDHLIKVLLLQSIDQQWKDHLLSIDHLKEGVGLRGYGQKDPKEEYKREAYGLFVAMMHRIRQDTVEKLCFIQLAQDEEVQRLEDKAQEQPLQYNRGEEEAEQKQQTVKRQGAKVGRNDPCPCGSGRKYKKCCGA